MPEQSTKEKRQPARFYFFFKSSGGCSRTHLRHMAKRGAVDVVSPTTPAMGTTAPSQHFRPAAEYFGNASCLFSQPLSVPHFTETYILH